MYLLLRDGFIVYCSLLYKDNAIESEDIIQDIFTKLWLSDLSFESIEKIKAYIYVSIKNSYFNHLKHKKHQEAYIETRLKEVDDRYDSDIIESELYAKIEQSLDTLPNQYAEIIRLFMQGYKSGEVAKLVNKPEQIVYNIKNKVVKKLRKKFGNSVTTVIFMLVK